MMYVKSELEDFYSAPNKGDLVLWFDYYPYLCKHFGLFMVLILVDAQQNITDGKLKQRNWIFNKFVSEKIHAN